MSNLPAGFTGVRWRSEALGKSISFFVYSPPSDPLDTARRLPVLYLLHGSGHDRHSVVSQIRPQDCLGELGETMLVIPDGDQGWWLDSPAQPKSRYGSYLLELVHTMDQSYPTRTDRGGRGICGFSMGGHGAMLLAGQHADLFGSASSLLGPLDIVQMFPEYHRLAALLGPDQSTWQRHNPLQRAAGLSRTALYFCTASTAFDRPQNDLFAAALRDLGIPFQYEVHPGEHDTDFVRQHIGDCFQFHRRAFAHRAS